MPDIQNLLRPAIAELQTTIPPSAGISTEALGFDWNWSVEGATAPESALLAQMLEETQKFVTAMQRGARPYVFSLLGKSEIGKTHLAKRAARFFERWLERYVDPATGARLSRRGGRVEWRRVTAAARSGEWRILDDLERDYFVVLDDVGAEHQTESQFTVSILDRILNERVGRRWTMITANKSIRQISEDWDARIASRLRRDGGSCVDVQPQDLRMYEKRVRRTAG